MRLGGCIEAPWDAQSGHVCWVFETDAGFRHAAVAFLSEGLERRERLVYVAERSSLDLLKADLSDLGPVGQLADDGALLLIGVAQLYEPGGSFDSAVQLSTWRALVDTSLKAGYTGICVAADATALVVTPEARRRFVRYELSVDRFIAGEPMRALCAYDRRVLQAATNELCAVHPQRRTPADADPGFCLYFDRDRLHLDGELDILNREVLASALDAAANTANGSLTLDVSALDFLDVDAMRQLDRLTLDLSARNSRVRVTGVPSHLRRYAGVLEFAGLAAAFDEENGR